MKYTSERVLIGSRGKGMEHALDEVDQFCEELALSHRDTMRMRLLAEETLGMVRSIVGIFSAAFWVEGDENQGKVCLEARGMIDQNKKEELLSVSTTGQNTMETGFMGVVRSLFMGSARDTREWTLASYREEIRSQGINSDAYENLERSIVANLAKDIHVGVHEDQIRMEIIREFGQI